MTAEVYLGTQGWAYDGWVGTFYPHGTAPSRMLNLYARVFPAVELEATAFGLPPEALLAEWAAQVPEWFRFLPRLLQEVTHERRLVDAERVVRRFVDRLATLGDRLGPLLILLSPAFRPTDANRSTLDKFLAGLPPGRRWAVEFRHPGWLTSWTTDLLRAHGVATVLVDGRWIPRDMMTEVALEPTADFSVVRWIGTKRQFTDVSRPQADRRDDAVAWQRVVAAVADRVDTVFGFFDNQYEGHAPHSAQRMQRAMGMQPVPVETLRDQGELL